uniref:Mucin-5AC-like isoform X1 n=1 Tax=Petromyzon marinus TaxID=7757 RepID=A0AAJ7X238_PETMA|nr:mucin-5AC-like isoform X1 [Petromyzon marinus]XP_032818241.1 mucin-5AC-like isoform X1 [Petromyzon marinus]XP_032818242.1 mucin-5AC-like isoform X1 [Petromyzon marinus]XP_032818243.1 mucin-5AC-like isoform X1 [Petromyzon marinus]
MCHSVSLHRCCSLTALFPTICLRLHMGTSLSSRGVCCLCRPPHRVEAPGRGDSGSTVWSTGTSTQDSLGVPSPSFSQLSTSPDTGLSVLSSSVSSPTISDTRSPLSTHSSHGSPEQDSPLPSPDVATSQGFVSPIPAFPSSRSNPLPFTTDRSGLPTAGVFAVIGTPLLANGATAPAATGGFASRPSGTPSQQDEEMEVLSDTSAQAQAPVFLFPIAPASAARELERGSTQREAAEREMAEAELLSYSENLENEAYLPAMEVLQVDMIMLPSK